MTRKLFLCLLLAGLPAVVSWATSQDSDQSQAAQEDSEQKVKRLGEASSDDYQLDLSIPRTPAGVKPGSNQASLPDPDQNAHLQALLKKLAAHPGNSATLRELDELLSEVVSAADTQIEAWKLDDAARLLSVVREVDPRLAGLADASRKLVQRQKIRKLLDQAKAARADGRLYQPAGDNALTYYQRAAELDPAVREVQQGLREVQQAMVANAIDAARNFDFEAADKWLDQASGVRKPQDLVEEARVKVGKYRDQKAEAIEQDVLKAIGRGDFDYAEFTLIDLIALGGHEDRVAALREKIARERVYGQYVPGQVVQDRLLDLDGYAPAVVVVAAGSFMMGAAESDRSAPDNESPRHRVNIQRGFGLGMQEISVAQFRTFVKASGYQTEAEAKGSSRVWDDSMGRLTDREGVNWRFDFQGDQAAGGLPVVHVSWNDAAAYARWLSAATGAHYRLPSEAEFEYALRADSTTRYWWGDSRPDEAVENLTGEEDQSAGGRKWSSFFRSYRDGYWGPAPGASFTANGYGLYDMAGNVSEWVADCWHATYVRAPVDGSAWDNPGCEHRVVRGGNWASAPEQARSSARLYASDDLRGPIVGFRIARDL